MTVAAEDAFGNVVTSYAGSETVALASNPGGSTLGGTLTVAAASGLAAFSNLTLNKVASGYTLKVTSGTFSAATSSAISVTPGAVTKLLLSASPAGLTAGNTTAVTITRPGRVQQPGDDFQRSGHAFRCAGRSELFHQSARLILRRRKRPSPPRSTRPARRRSRLPTRLQPLTERVARFRSRPGQRRNCSSPVNRRQRSRPAAGFGLTVAAEDTFGNVATGFNGSETVALASNPGGSTLGGTLVVSATGGVVGFSGLTINKTDGGYTLDVSSGTLSAATSSAVSVTPGAVSKLVVSASPAALTAGSGTAVSITAEDAFNNLVPTFGDSVTLSDALGGASFSSNPLASFSGGKATAAATLDKAGTQAIRPPIRRPPLPAPAVRLWLRLARPRNWSSPVNRRRRSRPAADLV